VDSAGNAYIAGTTYSRLSLTSTAFGVPSKDHPCAFVTKLNAAGKRNRLVGMPGQCGRPPPSLWMRVAASTCWPAARHETDPGRRQNWLLHGTRGVGGRHAVDAAGNVYLVGTADESFAATAGAYQPALAPGTCYSTFGATLPSPLYGRIPMKLGTGGSVVYAHLSGRVGPPIRLAPWRSIRKATRGSRAIRNRRTSPSRPAPRNPLSTVRWTWGRCSTETPSSPNGSHRGEAVVFHVPRRVGAGCRPRHRGGQRGRRLRRGGTQSTDFPTTSGALQRVYGGGNPIPSFAGDAFVVKFNASGLVVYSTFIAALKTKRATAIAVDPQGNVYVNAYPNTSTQIPITLSELSPDGSAILNTATAAGWFAVDGQSSVYLAAPRSATCFFPRRERIRISLAAGLMTLPW